MKEIKIIEYERQYARSLAEMWNKSAAEWGGFETVYDEKRVIDENEDSANRNIWLALDGDEVVGYCSFAEYREDKGASYIPLLNVRPDYHGNKVGKALLLRAVEEAIAQGWPRLDLHTWPGNLKAVPLYKKCGFFWEKQDDTTHLMNFIPSVMQIEAVADFFRTAHWYKDSVRPIEVKPDGREENRFEYLEYLWERAGSRLRLEFERRGRGLRLIETDDYCISAEVEDLNLVFDRSYQVRYRIVNKSGAPLAVELKGLADENIRLDLASAVEVAEEETVTAQFYVGPVEEEQSERRTHPTVAAELSINGKKAVFKVGIVPKFPAAISVKATEAEFVPGQDWGLCLDWENNFRQRATFCIELPASDLVQLDRRRFTLDLPAGGRISMAVPGTVRRLGHYSGKAKISAVLADGEQVQFEHDIAVAMPGAGAVFGAETREHWLLCNGRTVLKMRKFDNSAKLQSLDSLQKHTGDTAIMDFPSLGPPWSNEMAKLKPRSVHYYRRGEAMVLEACFCSLALPGVELTVIYLLHATGILELKYGIANRSQNSHPLRARMAVHQNFRGAVLPYRDRIVEITGAYGNSLEAYSTGDISENWLFVWGEATSRGLTWPAHWQLRSWEGSWQFEQDLGALAPGQEAEMGTFVLALNTWRRWEDFRRYAVGAKELPQPVQNFELDINDKNPFVGEEFIVAVREQKASSFDGRLAIRSRRGLVPEQAKEYNAADDLRQTEFLVRAGDEPAADELALAVDFQSVSFVRRRAVFKPKGEVRAETGSREGLKVLKVDNGVLRFAAAPSFAPALYSLEYQGRQWLDTAFPTPCARSWWNPWYGGSSARLASISYRSLLEEQCRGEFVTVGDERGNQWQGLDLMVDFRNHEKFRGLQLHYYALTLPGLPLMCHLLKLVQNTGRTLIQAPLVLENFLIAEGGWFVEHNRAGEQVTYRVSAGHEPMVRCQETIWFGIEGASYVLQYVAAGLVAGYLNAQVLHPFMPLEMTVRDGESRFSRPVFAIFAREPMDREAIRDLKRIRF